MQEEKENMRNEEVVDNTDYIDAIKDLKENSVDKAKYDSLKAENKKLLDALVNGQEIELPKQDQLESRLDYYKKYKENKFNSDLEYWDNFLKLREATIKEYGKDPCVTGSYGLDPEGNPVEPSYGEAEAISEQMDIIKGFIEEAEGNPLVFDTLMQSSVKKR